MSTLSSRTEAPFRKVTDSSIKSMAQEGSSLRHPDYGGSSGSQELRVSNTASISGSCQWKITPMLTASTTLSVQQYAGLPGILPYYVGGATHGTERTPRVRDITGQRSKQFSATGIDRHIITTFNNFSSITDNMFCVHTKWLRFIAGIQSSLDNLRTFHTIKSPYQARFGAQLGFQ